MRVTVLLLAAGSGRRLGSETPKQYLRVAGETLLVHCLRSLSREPRIDAVQPVIAEGDAFFSTCIEGHDFPFSLLPAVTGGAERALSMANGLAVLPGDTEWVAVHDVARPVPPADMLTRLFDVAAQHGAAIPALPVTDTIKQVDAEGRVLATLDRHQLRAVQTPQVAKKEWYDRAVDQLQRDLHTHTDDASLLEAAGYPVFVCVGDAANRKITTPEDMDWLQQHIEGDAA